jgi:hypothetical protein
MKTGVNSIGIRLRELGYSSYKEYLFSEHWKDFKRRFFSEHKKMRGMMKRLGKYVCQGCKTDGRLEVHHWTYKNLGKEKLGDVLLLCRNCHETVHIFHRQDLNLHRATNKALKLIKRNLRLKDKSVA